MSIQDLNGDGAGQTETAGTGTGFGTGRSGQFVSQRRHRQAGGRYAAADFGRSGMVQDVDRDTDTEAGARRRHITDWRAVSRIGDAGVCRGGD